MLELLCRNNGKYGIYDSEDNTLDYISEDEMKELTNLGYKIRGYNCGGAYLEIRKKLALNGRVTINGYTYRLTKDGQVELINCEMRVTKGVLNIYIEPFVNVVDFKAKYVNLANSVIRLYGGVGLIHCKDMLSGLDAYMADLTDFTPISATSFGGMFRYSSFEIIRLNNMPSYNVKDMRFMFEHCTRLINVFLNGLNTRSVTDMGSMFDTCTMLQSLNISGFDVSSVKNISKMFKDCYQLESLRLWKGELKSLSAGGASQLFDSCYKLNLNKNKLEDIVLFHYKQSRSAYL